MNLADNLTRSAGSHPDRVAVDGGLGALSRKAKTPFHGEPGTSRVGP